MIDWTNLVMAGCAVVTAATPVMVWLVGRAQKITARRVAVKAEQVRERLEATQRQMNRRLDDIHGAVASERDAAQERMHILQDEIHKLTSNKIKLEK